MRDSLTIGRPPRHPARRGFSLWARRVSVFSPRQRSSSPECKSPLDPMAQPASDPLECSAMNTTASSMLVVTGVDGILRCAQTGSCRDTLAALRWLATYDVPVVMASHGSAADVVRFQAEVGLRHPFIADSGAAIFI